MADTVTVAIEEEFDPAAAELIDNAINHYNMTTTGYYDYRSVNILLRDEQRSVRGGAMGGIWGEWFYLRLLWVAEELRGQGYGSQLLALAEAEAIAGNCLGIYLETFDFQGYTFYQRFGYAAVGQLNDFPPGHTHYTLAKRLR
jgi:GNAT superfamily N-acetyltransferase